MVFKQLQTANATLSCFFGCAGHASGEEEGFITEARKAKVPQPVAA